MNYNYEQYKKNMEILSGFEKIVEKINDNHPVQFEIKDKHGKLTKVSKEEFAWWMVNEKGKDSWIGGVASSVNAENPEGKLVEVNKDQFIGGVASEKAKESLVYGAKGDIDGTEYFVERKGGNEVIRESYYQPRSEEEKKQIIERNKERRNEEKENSQTQKLENQPAKEENSPNSTQKNEVQTQKDKNSSDSNSKNKGLVWGGIGAVGLLGIVVGVIKIRK